MLRKVIFTLTDYKESPNSKQTKLNVEIEFQPAIKGGQLQTPVIELSERILDTIQKFIEEKKRRLIYEMA